MLLRFQPDGQIVSAPISIGITTPSVRVLPAIARNIMGGHRMYTLHCMSMGATAAVHATLQHLNNRLPGSMTSCW
jgi:hypothetical protein